MKKPMSLGNDDFAMMTATLQEADHEIWEIFEGEYDRQTHTLDLIASENAASRACMEATGSIFTNKYAEGLPGRRYYRGCLYMDRVEQLAIDRCKQVFGCNYANVQPHSGTQANMAVFLAVLEPGDRVLAMDLAHGGHLSHGMAKNFSGASYDFRHYGLNRETEMLDFDEIARLAREHKPKMIIAGASAYPRTIDFPTFAQIAREVDALLMCDIAHIAGLVAAGIHPDPVAISDFVTTTTHKTLRGPRGGLVMTNRQELERKLNSAVFPGMQGGPGMQSIAAKAVALGEALRPGFRAYQQQIVRNAAALAERFRFHGERLVAGGTDNHLLLLDLRRKHPDLDGQEASIWLERAGIITNRNLVPFDSRTANLCSGLRFGSPTLTTRGLKEDEMRLVADWIHEILSGSGDDDECRKVAQGVRELCQRFPIPK